MIRSLSITTGYLAAGGSLATPSPEASSPFSPPTPSLSASSSSSKNTLWSNFFNLLQSRMHPNYHISMC